MKNKWLLSLLFILTAIVLIFHSCAKDKGQPQKVPFNLLVVEGFENSSSLPDGWKIFNYNNDAAWEVVTSAASKGNHAIGFNNCDGNGTKTIAGTKDWLVTPSYDFSKATNVNLSFDVAYAVVDSNGITNTDSLRVLYSIDNGANWIQIYKSGGEDLSNSSPLGSQFPCWMPTDPSEWRTDFIAANELAGQASVFFAFENYSGGGQWILLDNITINASNGADNCDGVTYTKSIAPIIASECATPACHAPGGTGPTDLTSFEGLKTIADDGSLKKRMSDGNPSIMPPTGKLANSELSKVICWINAGATKN